MVTIQFNIEQDGLNMLLLEFSKLLNYFGGLNA